MNSRQLQYAIILSEHMNISKASEILGISQPALSKQILGLEKELGVTLFDRETLPLKLTAAGERFIEEAKELILKEEMLKKSMEDYKKGDRGRLVIGISPFRATYFLSSVIKEMYKEFPGLQIVLKEEKSTQLKKDIIEGVSDIAIVNLPVDETLLDVIPLCEEEIVIVVPNCFLKEEHSAEKDVYPTAQLSDFKDVPFIGLNRSQELRKLFDKLCAANSFSPEIRTEVVGISTAWNLASCGIGATVLPIGFVKENMVSEEVSVYSIKDAETVRSPAIVTRKGQSVSKYAQKAIKLIAKTQNDTEN